MDEHRVKKSDKIHCKKIYFILALTLISLLAIWSFLSFESFPGHVQLNAWLLKRLVELGVKKEDIEPLFLGSSFFGTLREARGVSQEVINRGYNVLILVSSPYHTMRLQECFSRYLKDKGINVFVYQLDDYPRLWGLVLEYLKLIVYEKILL